MTSQEDITTGVRYDSLDGQHIKQASLEAHADTPSEIYWTALINIDNGTTSVASSCKIDPSIGDEEAECIVARNDLPEEVEEAFIDRLESEGVIGETTQPPSLEEQARFLRDNDVEEAYICEWCHSLFARDEDGSLPDCPDCGYGKSAYTTWWAKCGGAVEGSPKMGESA